MTVDSQIRYYMEQTALPNALYNTGSRFLSSFICNKEQAMPDCYRCAEKANPTYSCPYTSKDFDVDYRKFSSDDGPCMIVRVKMPTPEYHCLSRAVYFCSDDYGTNLYFTSELSDAGKFVLCCQDDKSRHINAGPAPADDREELDQVVSLFREFKTFS